MRNETQLKENFVRILNERNADKLEGTPILDSEFKRIMIVKSDKSVFESAQILRDKYVLERDDKTTDEEERAHSITAIWHFEKQNDYLKYLKR